MAYNKKQTLRRTYVFNKKISENLISEASSILSKAKSVHDELEKYYITAIDFNKVNNITDKLIEKLSD